MSRTLLAALLMSMLPLLTRADTTLMPDPPIRCSSCDEWNAPREPFKVFGNTYYVGVAGLASVLITSPHGHILVDGGLPQSAPLIDANIRSLGFRTSDVRLIVVSHEHFDHVGGIAALQRASGSMVAASAAAARALRRGEPGADDPQFGFGYDSIVFPRVARVRAVRDGETLEAGDLAITAHVTPGHTVGSTSWSWRSCEGTTCLNVVYADSLNPVSAPGFRFTGDSTHPSRVALFEKSIDRIAMLPCDIILAPHPGFIALDTKLAARTSNPSRNPFIDPHGCSVYADDARRALEERVKQEKTSARRSG